MTAEALREAFAGRFGAPPRVARAPGRVNLIGEHTDYNEGFVLPVAIGLSARVAFAPIAGSSLVVRSSAFDGEEVEIGLRTDGRKRGHWSDYVRGVLRVLEDSAVPVPPVGLWIESDVPLGAGLSSSAAIEVATAQALLASAGVSMVAKPLALACQRAENEFVGTRCGLMDPLVACLGRKDHALLVDCRSGEASPIPFPDTIEIGIVNSGIRHSLADGEYNRRRADCEAAVARLRSVYPGISSLRDVAPEALERARAHLSATEHRRARHVVSENARVLDFVAALREADFERMGGLLAGSQASLAGDYEVSCPELDLLVRLARRHPALIGARMTGGGFGGCTVNLVRAGQGGAFVEAMASAYERELGRRPETWLTRPAAGAGID